MIKVVVVGGRYSLSADERGKSIEKNTEDDIVSRPSFVCSFDRTRQNSSGFVRFNYRV